MAAHKAQFRPSSALGAPQASIGVFVICAESEKRAQYLAASRDLSRLRPRQGILLPFPPPEEALAYPYTDIERRVVEHHRHRQIVGTPEQVKAELEALAASYGVDEVVVLTITHDYQARKHSYALLAEAFGLTPPG